MQYHLFDTPARFQLLPFTHTRAIAHIRCGVLTPKERWEHILNTTVNCITESYLQVLHPPQFGAENTYINSTITKADTSLVKAIQQLQNGEVLMRNDVVLAFCTQQHLSFENIPNAITQFKPIEYSTSVLLLEKAWHIFAYNEQMIVADFALITQNRESQPIPSHVTALTPENIFIEEGAIVNPSIINASKGPVYIGKDAEIMEGCLIRGPFALCENAVLKMGAKVYTGTTIGPGCKVGGEISNVVFFANSNKGHDGFLGNAVIGEWCNLGADTNCSNLKNNYEQVKIWNEYENKSEKTGLQFCGLLMGDHSKCGINTMFNTGTVVGVSCNIYGSGFPPNFVPSFSWGGAENMVPYRTEKAFETANNMMGRRNKTLSDQEKQALTYVYQHTQPQREMLHIK